MKKEIKSFMHQFVRIKRQYIRGYYAQYMAEGEFVGYSEYEDGFNNGKEPEYIIETGTPFDSINSWIDNPMEKIFRVKGDIYGVDMYSHRSTPLDTWDDDIHLKHQLYLVEIDSDDSLLLWDAKYFEVVTRKVVEQWVTDNEFNK